MEDCVKHAHATQAFSTYTKAQHRSMRELRQRSKLELRISIKICIQISLCGGGFFWSSRIQLLRHQRYTIYHNIVQYTQYIHTLNSNNDNKQLPTPCCSLPFAVHPTHAPHLCKKVTTAIHVAVRVRSPGVCWCLELWVPGRCVGIFGCSPGIAV